VVNFGDFSVGYLLRFWLDDYSMFQPIESAIRERLWHALRREKITIPYPTSVRFQHVRPWIDPPPPAPPEILDRVDLLTPLTEDERQMLQQRLIHAVFAPGEPVVVQGALADSLYVVESGELGVFVDGDNGGLVEVGALGPGDAFGEMALLTGEPRTATVRAATEASLYRIDKEALAPLLKDNPTLAIEMSKLIEGRREKTQAMLASSTRSPEETAEHSVLSRIAHYFGLANLT
jgi:CRP-like cAMP-binding protein